MQYTCLTLLLFTYTTLAAPQSLPQPTDSTLTVPSTVMSILESSIPSADFSAICNSPETAESAIHELALSNPVWFHSLPSSVQEWASAAFASPIPTSVGNNPVKRASGHGSNRSNNGVGGSNDPNKTSTGGAAAPTGPVAVGLVGAAGLLAIALGV
ncbi:uncharacterized protein BDW47DRAFT_122643 [Aspergillus candidus]|uniref:GPI anchored protein n=1 Tax=Aspergillus candidus TaxID=41067 RepID=A0A2I2FLU5_ASPCN|nr:hypothetical protein BDW47DRAFT_122643 [Aspergillus candidus]PLB41605.1 hypothetical protein BDW47DRAFT_122643 [Aspergillus candidus]